MATTKISKVDNEIFVEFNLAKIKKFAQKILNEEEKKEFILAQKNCPKGQNLQNAIVFLSQRKSISIFDWIEAMREN